MVDPSVIKGLYRNSHAIIIGISKYAANPIPNATNDAKDIEEILIDRYGFPEKNVLRLYDEDATYKNIRSILKKPFAKSKKYR